MEINRLQENGRQEEAEDVVWKERKEGRGTEREK